MENYYDNEEFRHILSQYEAMKDGNGGCLLEAEELAEIAEYYRNLNRYEETNDVIEYALNLYPGALEPLVIKAHMALEDKDDPDEANTIAEQITDKNDPDYFCLKAEILLATHKKDEASDYLADKLHNVISPEEREDFIIACALLFSSYNELQEAKIWLSVSADQDSIEHQEILGHILSDCGDAEGCEKVLEKLLDANPYSTRYWGLLAQSQFLRCDFQSSVNSSDFALAIDPNDALANLYKANSLFGLHDYDGALKHYEKYRENASYIDLGQFYVTLSNLYFAKGEIVKGLECYQKAILEADDKRAACVHIGISLYSNGIIDMAYALLAVNLMAVDESWTTGYAQLARCCYELNNEAEYDLWMRIAIERSPDESKEHLGDLYPEDTDPADYPNIPVVFPKQKTPTDSEPSTDSDPT